jgi:hypothetical protein
MSHKSTAWMWQDGVATRGVNLDFAKQRLLWQEDLVGFGCALQPIAQPLDDFLVHGAARFGNPPQDILDEIHESIEGFQQME